MENDTKPKKTIKIYVGDKLIGVIQTLTEPQFENTGSSTDGYVFSASRIRFDKLKMTEAFSRGYLHVHAQRYPLEIRVDDEVEELKINNAWLTETSHSYVTDDFVIVDEMKMIAESIEKKNE